MLEPWARVLGHGRRDGWRLVHRTFGEYLEGRLDLRDAHRKVAEFYVGQRWGRFDQWDSYGLRHVATHLAEAADRAGGQERHDLVAQLARLVTDQGFQQAHLAELRDPTLLRRDLELAHRLTAKDDHPDATFLLVPVALTQVLFHRQAVQAEAMFEAARKGNVKAAERLLDLFSGDVDAGWHDAILLAVAWLAVERAPAEAARVRDRVRDALGPDADAVEEVADPSHGGSTVTITLHADGAQLRDHRVGKLVGPRRPAQVARPDRARERGLSKHATVDRDVVDGQQAPRAQKIF